METVYDKYMDSYSFKYIKKFYGCHFSKMAEKLKTKIRGFGSISSLIGESIFN